MAYLNHDSDTIIVDATLTKKGRELLAKGKAAFNITKFALSDDEVNYDLWNPNHPNGSDYYGAAIENTPVLEASPNEVSNLKFKLITLDKDKTHVAVLSGMENSLTLESGQSYTLIPQTIPSGLDASSGYTLTLLDSTFAEITGITENNLQYANNHSSIPTGTSVTVGTKFIIKAKNKITDSTTTLIVTGNNSGATHTINLTVKAVVVNGAGEIITGGTV